MRQRSKKGKKRELYKKQKLEFVRAVEKANKDSSQLRVYSKYPRA